MSFYFLIFSLLFCMPMQSFAEDATETEYSLTERKVAPRVFMSVGPWMSTYSHTYGKQKMDLTSYPSIGFQLSEGLTVKQFFFEFNQTWLASSSLLSDDEARLKDAIYYAIPGANIGFAFSAIPIELYLGGDNGNYKLPAGSSPRWGGWAAHLGGNYFFAPTSGDSFRFGFKAEYRRFFANSDDSGRLPGEISVRSHLFFIGVNVGLR